MDLGFAAAELPSGRTVSFVDVPGHERFIRNMLAGVGGVDACLFVVAASEGSGFLPKVLTAILVSFFPILVNTITGLRSADANMIRLMNSLFAPKRMIFTKIRFKYSLPYIFAGLRIASTLSVIGAIVGEFVGADRGIGFFLIMSMSELEVARVFMGVFFCTLIGLTLFFAVVILEKYMIPWHISTQTN